MDHRLNAVPAKHGAGKFRREKKKKISGFFIFRKMISEKSVPENFENYFRKFLKKIYTGL
jgi:hypothetical protein